MQDTKLWEEPSSNASVERFSKVLQFNTVSDPTQKLHVRHPEAFQQLDAFLRDSYPRVFSTLTVEKVGEGRLSFLITWNGTVPRLNPALFISHQDVVPVTPGTEKDWTYPPFSGAIAEGYVWGRGAMDVKIGVVGLLEAAEQLLAEGFTPQRTVMFAFGQDEEVGGGYGAGEIAKLLHKRGVKVDIVQDEGGGISRDGCPPFTTHPLALIGTAEKGYATWQVVDALEGPFRAMRLFDGDAPVMGQVFDVCQRVTDGLKQLDIARAKRDALVKAWTDRWDYFHSPLHYAGYALNPKCRQDEHVGSEDVMGGFLDVLRVWEASADVRR